MVRIANIKIDCRVNRKGIKEAISKKLNIKSDDIIQYSIVRESLDARKKENIHYVYTVDAKIKGEKKLRGKDISNCDEYKYIIPENNSQLKNRPVVIGFGPAGMFASLILSEAGLKPIVIERGKAVNKREESVSKFWKTGVIDTESNVQFGEGGAGTFSDGKLTTRIKDIRCKKVLDELYNAGAPEEILFSSKPHIGTDKLKEVVKNIRNKIISLGGDVLFSTRLDDIILKNGVLEGILANGNIIQTDAAILSIGHSARDTFEMIYNKGIIIEQKPFAVGVRIEHNQEYINSVQYGDFSKYLSAADYRLTHTTSKGRGVYTFCMCPGGYVVAASSEERRLCVNGMSDYARDGENANSALLVQVYADDFQSSHPLSGVEFQRHIEESAYNVSKSYNAPVQLLEDFINGVKSKKLRDIKSTYMPGIVFADINNVLPKFISESIKEAIPYMGKKLKGFDYKYSVLTGVETRSSSPIRILRDNITLQSLNAKGLYPCGEGAGYAGGIVSAAVDGIKCAESILNGNPNIGSHNI